MSVPHSASNQDRRLITESLVLVQETSNTDTPYTGTNKNTALTSILNGLKLRDESNRKSMWSRYSKTSTPYDIIIRINSLTDLRTQGWEILLGLHLQKMLAADSTLSNKKEVRTTANAQPVIRDGVVVTILGAYNRGKSFLLNQLCRITVPTGNLIHTEGISITAGRDNYTNIVFLDTAGTDTPVKNDEIDSKRATEALLREVVLHICTFIIIVVNRLRATDQIYIREILKYCQTSTKKAGVIIVHNLHDVETVIDLNQTIENEIETIFKAELQESQPVLNGVAQQVKFFLSKQSDIDIRHFVLAKDGSPAAKIWNTQSLDAIMNLFQNSTEHFRKLDIIDSMTQFINTKLPRLFVQNNSPVEKLEIVQHDNQPFIVLSDRRSRQDLQDEPCSLELIENLIYDNAGFFLKHEIEQWQPRYNFYETKDDIRLVLELPGFKKGKCDTKLLEKSITIKGNREDFNESPESTTIRQTDIPCGSFKLQIPFPCDIDTQTVTTIRDEGFIIITAAKRKIIEGKIDI